MKAARGVEVNITGLSSDRLGKGFQASANVTLPGGEVRSVSMSGKLVTPGGVMRRGSYEVTVTVVPETEGTEVAQILAKQPLQAAKIAAKVIF